MNAFENVRYAIECRTIRNFICKSILLNFIQAKRLAGHTEPFIAIANFVLLPDESSSANEIEHSQHIEQLFRINLIKF